MTMATFSKIGLLSTAVGATLLDVMGCSLAIAQEIEAMMLMQDGYPSSTHQEFRPLQLPAQITNEFRAIRFTKNPYGTGQRFTLSDDQKQGGAFRTVTDEVHADAPKSESYNSGFKIRFGLDTPPTSAEESDG